MNLLPFGKLPVHTPRRFVPAAIDLGDWSQSAPLFDRLEANAAAATALPAFERCGFSGRPSSSGLPAHLPKSQGDFDHSAQGCEARATLGCGKQIHPNPERVDSNQPLFDSESTGSAVYFLTANYKITPNWSVYGQYATSFLFPDITTLYFATAAAGLQSIQSQRTKTYQTGTVYSHGSFTADLDVYRVDATNLLQVCGSGVNTSDCNVGSAQYNGVEGEAAYAFDFGLTLFAI